MSEKCIIHRNVRIPKSMITDKKVKEDLILKDGRSDHYSVRETMTCYKVLTNNYIVPKSYGIRYIQENKLPHIDRQSSGESIVIRFKGSLREQQIPIVEETMDVLLKEQGATMNLYCGFGKTTCANMISCRISLKTLVLVHTSALAEQWKDRISQFVEGSSIGLIRQNIFDIEGRTHVIALMQSVCKRTYPEGAFDSFGLTIVDEAHHVCASELSKCITKAGSKYRLGLSATPYRKDGFTELLFNSIGRISSSVSRTNCTQELIVKTIHISKGPSKIHQTRRGGKPSINMARMISDLCEDNEIAEPRTRCIIQCIKNMLSENRHIIILSDRREHLNMLSRLVEEEGISDYGFMVGGVKGEDLAENSKCKVIFATYAFCSEGVDVPSLDTIILTTPRSDVIQCVGRILRKYDDKETPTVVDFIDQAPVFKTQYRKRQTYYKSLGGRIFNLNQELETIIRVKTSSKKRSKVDENNDELDKGFLSNFNKKMN